MSDLDIWEIVWGALGGAATALGALAFLSKKLVGHFFSKDLESHKAALKAENDTQLEAMRAENAEDLERIRSHLAVSKAEGDARREYEFDARKRLYQEYEPLLFQLIEACENTVYRVQSLARVARDGYLKPKSGWLSTESYYLLSTIYNLMAPMAIFRMIQRRLTMVDLRVDSGVRIQYLLAKQLYYVFTEHHEFALECEPRLEYTPNVHDWETKRIENPARYWRQGLAIGRHDNAVDALLTRETDGLLRPLTFGEFEAQYFQDGTNVHGDFSVVADLFIDFHPRFRPVLWRVLITQVYLCKGIIRTEALRESQVSKNFRPLCTLNKKEREKLDWRQSRDGVPDEKVLVEPFQASEQFLAERLGEYVDFPDSRMDNKTT